MKIHLIFILAAALSPFAGFAQSRQEVEVDLQHVVKKISTENYNVYEAAARVYQAKESITVARMNLLPRLNLWKLASAAFEIFLGGPGGIATGGASLVEDIAPFLVPANWFRVAQTKILVKADEEGYRALWGNELLTAKALYYHILLDSKLRDHILQSQKELESIYKIVRIRETFGGSPESVSLDIKLRLLALDEDTRALNVLISEEESLLAYMMGYPTGSKLKVKAVDMPDYESLEKLEYLDFEYRAVDVSPEIRQFDYFISASDLIRKEISYAFLGASSLSRGVNGGIFDNIPVQPGLGFGTGASLRISRSQKEILKVQQKGVQETVKRHLKLLVDNYNLDIDNYNGMKQRVALAKKSLNQLYQRVQLGAEVDSLQLIEASRNYIDADTALFGVMFRFLNNEDKLSRLIFYGDYSKAPASITSLGGQRL
jgi:outer membrane protein TolC